RLRGLRVGVDVPADERRYHDRGNARPGHHQPPATRGGFGRAATVPGLQPAVAAVRPGRAARTRWSAGTGWLGRASRAGVPALAARPGGVRTATSGPAGGRLQWLPKDWLAIRAEDRLRLRGRCSCLVADWASNVVDSIARVRDVRH